METLLWSAYHKCKVLDSLTHTSPVCHRFTARSALVKLRRVLPGSFYHLEGGQSSVSLWKHGTADVLHRETHSNRDHAPGFVLSVSQLLQKIIDCFKENYLKGRLSIHTTKHPGVALLYSISSLVCEMTFFRGGLEPSVCFMGAELDSECWPCRKTANRINPLPPFCEKALYIFICAFT